MSRFFKGKNLDRLSRDAMEAMEYVVKQGKMRELYRKTFKKSQELRKKLKNQEITGEECHRQLQKLKRQYQKEKQKIEEEMEAWRKKTFC